MHHVRTRQVCRFSSSIRARPLSACTELIRTCIFFQPDVVDHVMNASKPVADLLHDHLSCKQQHTECDNTPGGEVREAAMGCCSWELWQAAPVTAKFSRLVACSAVVRGADASARTSR